MQTVSDYNKVIKQKNRILQDSAETGMSLAETEDLVAPWNEQLVQLGASNSSSSRTDYIERLNRYLNATLRAARDPNSLCLVAGRQGRFA